MCDSSDQAKRLDPYRVEYFKKKTRQLGQDENTNKIKELKRGKGEEEMEGKIEPAEMASIAKSLVYM